jgi:type IV secretion system protein VirB8
MTNPSKRTSQILQHAQDWTASERSLLQESRKTAWMVAGVAIVLAVGAFITAAVVWAKMAEPVRPDLIEVDRLTGAVQRLNVFDVEKVSSIDVLYRYFAAKYVKCRETYFFDQLNDNYQCSMLMSEGQALDSYTKIYTGDDARHKVLKNTQQWDIEVGNVQIDPLQPATLIVPYTKTVKTGTGAPLVGQFVSRLTFRFLDNLSGSLAEKLISPVGFKVVSYVTDAEAKR